MTDNIIYMKIASKSMFVEFSEVCEAGVIVHAALSQTYSNHSICLDETELKELRKFITKQINKLSLTKPSKSVKK